MLVNGLTKVDGDSGYCHCLIGLKKKKVIVGGKNSNTIQFEI